MKILFICGEGDYDANTFEASYAGQSVKTIIDKHKKGEPLIANDGDVEVQIAYRIVETPDIVISKEFRTFIKNDLLDYDAGKHSNFYLEWETV